MLLNAFTDSGLSGFVLGEPVNGFSGCKLYFYAVTVICATICLPLAQPHAAAVYALFLSECLVVSYK